MIGIAHKAGASKTLSEKECHEPLFKTPPSMPLRHAQRMASLGFDRCRRGFQWGFVCMNPATRVFAPIPTLYQGVQFRSRTEARWAAFFDAINATKAAAVIEFMDCPPEREAELADLIRRPQGVVISRPAQGVMPL